jgi:tetratricopeptide (TPR) repeat protein/transglutaminase-like putative cysteine protease
MIKTAFVFALLASSAAVHAGDQPIYAAIPDWVVAAPAIDASKLGDDAPIFLQFDNQQRLQDGQIWSYTDGATRASSAEIMGAIGTIQLPWNPAHGDLIIHKLEIIRGSEHIDKLADKTGFSVLRREQQLERRSLDGVLTATKQIEGLRIGDVLHLSYSITTKDTALGGKVQTFAPAVFAPAKIGFARVRLLWPENARVKWKSLAQTNGETPVTQAGMTSLTFKLPFPKQAEIPTDAPLRYQPIPLIEATTFSDWADVSATMAPLFKTDGLIAPQSPLAAEVDRISKAESDPLKRTALALQSVQEKIRYQLMGMNSGNYVPETPAKTWELRYGDCKAKTLLLLSMLHAMGIEAQPVLAGIQMGNLLPNRLPSVGAFDHVLVRAKVNGQTLWLDGTGLGARLPDIHDMPLMVSYVLPLQAEGATLYEIPKQANARPNIASTVEIDSSAGVSLPAPFKMSVQIRGAEAEALRASIAQTSKQDQETVAEGFIKTFVDSYSLASHSFSFDAVAGTATVDLSGLAYLTWAKEDGRWRLPLDTAVSRISFTPDRARAAWKDIPVTTNAPSYRLEKIRLRLPSSGKGFTLDGAQPLATMLGGSDVNRTVVQDGEWLTISSAVKSTGMEIAASAVPEERKKLALAEANPPKTIAPADYPQRLIIVEQARRENKIAGILATYNARIAAKPDQAIRYSDRAWFYDQIFDRKMAIADLTKALAIEPDVDKYLRRSSLYFAVGDNTKSEADALAARDLDPSSDEAVEQLTSIKTERGDYAGAIALLDEKINAGGKDKITYLGSKAQILAESGAKEEAQKLLDTAITQTPGNPGLLNARCWLKGTMNIALDTALKDCTKSIELSDNSQAALDSRAMVYFRMNRFDEALADLDAVLTTNPDLAASMFMRGVINKRAGKAAQGDTDILTARTLSPMIDAKYKKYGIVP